MTDKILAGGGDELIPVRDLNPGERVRLRGGILAEIVENPRDGMWIVARYLENSAGPIESDQIEMVLADDVLARA
jgi:hypothetical protein